MTKNVYTVEEAAEVLGYHPESFRRALRKGRIKLKIIGQKGDTKGWKRYYFSQHEVHALADKRQK